MIEALVKFKCSRGATVRSGTFTPPKLAAASAAALDFGRSVGLRRKRLWIEAAKRMFNPN